jgi:integrase
MPAIHIKPVKNREKVFDISFSIALPNGKTHRARKRLVNVSKRQAQAWAEKRHTELLNPSAPAAAEAPTTLTFAQFVAEDIQAHYLPSLSVQYRKKVQATLDNRLLPTFGTMRLNEIALKNIEEYLITLRLTCQPKAQRDHLAVLRHLLQIALDKDLLEALPKFPKVKVQTSDAPKYLSMDEHKKILEEARDHEEFCLLLFATDSGTRSGEQLAIRWGDVLEQQLVIARSLADGTVDGGMKSTKSGKVRYVHLSKRLSDALQKLKQERLHAGISCNPDELVFGYVGNTKALYKRVVRACKRAGVEQTSRHGMRHTYASWLISSGKVSLAEVQQLLGHQSAQMTQRYAAFIPNQGANVRAVFDAAADAASETSE